MYCIRDYWLHLNLQLVLYQPPYRLVTSKFVSVSEIVCKYGIQNLKHFNVPNITDILVYYCA